LTFFYNRFNKIFIIRLAHDRRNKSKKIFNQQTFIKKVNGTVIIKILDVIHPELANVSKDKLKTIISTKYKVDVRSINF
jgi:Tol biopolymer transport system component